MEFKRNAYLWTNFQSDCKFVHIMTNNFIARSLSATIEQALRYLPVVTLTGPRQSGKTTLCRNLFPDLPYANFEDVAVLAEVQSDPKAFLNKYPHGAIIDEAQRYPEIFSYLQVLVDEDRHNGNSERHFIVTGSSNLSLMESITQSMAGRTAVLTLLPLSTRELLNSQKNTDTPHCILNGGYPAVWQAEEEARQMLLSSYYTTYIERDVRMLINVKDLRAFQTFIRMCAGRVGQEFNASSMSIEVGVSVNTIRKWTSILSASYIVYLLYPYYANIGKRLTKTPKLYFYDTGLASFLLGVHNAEQLYSHPQRGALFENMIVNDMMKHGTNQGQEEQLFFYRDKGQHEVDVIRSLPSGIEAYEIKSGQTYQTDFFRNLDYLKALLKEQITRTMVVYDGSQENDSTYNGICNFRHLVL